MGMGQAKLKPLKNNMYTYLTYESTPNTIEVQKTRSNKAVYYKQMNVA